MSGENMSKTNEVRPIDANALCAILEAKADMALVPEYKHAFLNVQAMVNAMPSIDAEPVRHGRWLYNSYPTVWYGHGEPPEWVCSECEERAYNTYDYCPNCGAKMDGENAHEV